jgi:HlyD family secretion protein
MLRAAAVGAAFAFAGMPALSAEEASPGQAADEVVLPAISVVPVERRVLRDRILASGTIAPVEYVSVQPQIEGQAIETLHVVAADEVLARLSTRDLELQKSQLVASRASAVASIAQAEAQVIDATANADEARRVWDRTEKLRAQGSATQAASDQAEAAATSARARVRLAEHALTAAKAQLDLVDAQIRDIDLRLGWAEIKAPFPGVIIERNARVGAIASGAGAPLFVIMRDGALELRADVAEQDVIRLAPGQSVSLRAIGMSDRMTGKVRLVEPVVAEASRLGKVRVSLDGSGNVMSGQFAEAEILVAERETLSLPVTAVSTGADGASVLRVGADGTVERIPVKTGIRDGALIEIVDGIGEGDLVVARAGAFVRPGERVRPIPAEAASTN